MLSSKLPEGYTDRHTCIVITDGEPGCYGQGQDGVKITSQT